MFKKQNNKDQILHSYYKKSSVFNAREKNGARLLTFQIYVRILNQ